MKLRAKQRLLEASDEYGWYALDKQECTQIGPYKTQKECERAIGNSDLGLDLVPAYGCEEHGRFEHLLVTT